MNYKQNLNKILLIIFIIIFNKYNNFCYLCTIFIHLIISYKNNTYQNKSLFTVDRIITV